MPKFNHEGFENLPVEEDTKVSSSNRVEIEGLTAIHECWSWEGTRAETLVFREKDLAGRSDDSLRKMVSNSSFCKAESALTVSRDRDGFAFVNFNFRT